MSDSVMLDINSYTFVDKMGESVVAREYTPILDGYFDDHVSQMGQGIVSGVASDQERDTVYTEASLDTLSSATSTTSNRTVVNIVDPGEKAGRDGLGVTSAGAKSPSSSIKSLDHSELHHLTEKDSDLLSKESEFSTERSRTDSDVPSSAMAGADSLHSTDSCDVNEDSDEISFTNTFQPDKGTSLELNELVADGDESGKQDRDETPMPPQEEGSYARDGAAALPTITMALISRRSRHRAGADEN